MLSSPTLIGSHDTNCALDVQIVGNLAFVADSVGGGVQIIDVSVPAEPRLVGAYDTPGQSWGVQVVGQTAYVADWSAGLQIVDVSTPEAPVLKGTYDTPGLPVSVQVIGELAYIADHFGGLQIVNVVNPSAPRAVGNYMTSGEAQDVRIQDHLAYVAAGAGGLAIINVADPAAPSLVGSFDTGNALSIQIVGHLAYVAAVSDGLKIIDVSSPSAPALLGEFDTPGEALGLQVVGTRAYVADGNSGLLIIDVSNPAAPTLLAEYLTSGRVYDLQVDGARVYLADGAEGLKILDVAGFVDGAPNPTISGTSSIDEYYIVRSGDNVSIYNGAGPIGTPLASYALSDLATLSFGTLAEDDRLHIDFSGGNPIPSSGLIFDGGEGSNSIKISNTSPHNDLSLIAGQAAVGSHSLSYANTQALDLAFDSGNQPMSLGSLRLAGSARLRLATAGRVFRLSSLSIKDTASLDLADNALLLQATPATRQALLDQLNALLRSGRNAGLWNGAGLISSSAAANPLASPAAILNPNAPDSILVQYALLGDTDLNGHIDATDYFRLNRAEAKAAAGWGNGDFNYDNSITLEDYDLIDRAFLAQKAAPAKGGAAGARRAPRGVAKGRPQAASRHQKIKKYQSMKATKTPKPR